MHVESPTYKLPRKDEAVSFIQVTSLYNPSEVRVRKNIEDIARVSCLQQRELALWDLEWQAKNDWRATPNLPTTSQLFQEPGTIAGCCQAACLFTADSASSVINSSDWYMSLTALCNLVWSSSNCNALANADAVPKPVIP